MNTFDHRSSAICRPVHFTLIIDKRELAPLPRVKRRQGQESMRVSVLLVAFAGYGIKSSIVLRKISSKFEQIIVLYYLQVKRKGKA